MASICASSACWPENPVSVDAACIEVCGGQVSYGGTVIERNTTGRGTDPDAYVLGNLAENDGTFEELAAIGICGYYGQIRFVKMV